ncbi:MAG TPA: cupin domain-containing protein [Candidatus Wallbacteria bacterium]|nr:MAG: Cupin domain protein [bacterium ADurb.Bin243]HOD39438.1 cupin domain-containing protein [Candidatus Wallbacteria bacterium]HPG59369.1 cupin domain-containing protein [Candidatus Wallbacteria bacterium]
MKIIVRKPVQSEIDFMKKQPIWECEPKTFPWHYDEKETCLILEGKVKVKAGKEEAIFAAGDLVIFPQGLDCEWTVSEKVRKHYKFGE